MTHPFWQLQHLSDTELLASLGSVLRTQQRTLAEIVAHLAEVEERRLHLKAACDSMFSYCVNRLGMTEDEACRRIELARLARRFPALFEELASGRISLSVALVLKSVLSQANHLELLAAARGNSIRQARELVATYAPKPDVPSGIRKLPDRPPARPSGAEASPQPLAPLAPSAQPAPSAVPARAVQAPPQRRDRAEPLSPERYRIQFTADAPLKAKLELARDLLRHAHPSGDFAPILSRALDLLLEQLQQRRFGKRRRPTPNTSAPAPGPTPASERSGISRASRRAVVARDGLGCSWVDADGVRCGSNAWLEFDHRHPAGQGGSSDSENLRLFCRAHNQLCAEEAYGREHIQRAIQDRRSQSAPQPKEKGSSAHLPSDIGSTPPPTQRHQEGSLGNSRFLRPEAFSVWRSSGCCRSAHDAVVRVPFGGGARANYSVACAMQSSAALGRLSRVARNVGGGVLVSAWPVP